MNQDNTTTDLLDDQPKPEMSSGLKALTILSFIGCALQFISSVWNYFSIQSSYKDMDKVVEQMNSDKMPAWAKSIAGDPAHFVALITKSYENRIPIVLMSLVAVGLCFYGVLQMRKLKKQGFLFYVIGELLPFVTLGLFIGSIGMTGMIFYISICIALLFILLYAMQRKNLVY